VRDERGPSLLGYLRSVLSAAESAALEAARRLCSERGWALFLVGGAVRDLMRGVQHLDLDLAVDGDAVALGGSLAAGLNALHTAYPAFGTATLAGMGWSLDLARTRRERHAAPASLPVVEPAAIEEDLARRDFTIHAMALALNGPNEGALLDPFDGQADLAARLLRVLHSESFRDDPTRILRLARYTARLGFAVEPVTAALATRDATYIGALSPARVGAELERIFREAEPERSLAVLEDLHALRRVYPELRITATLSEAFQRLREDGGGSSGTAEYLAALTAWWDRGVIQRLVDRLDLNRAIAAALRDVPEVARALPELRRRRDPAAIVAICERFHSSALRGVAARAGGAAYEHTRWFLRELRNRRPLLRGDDVLALGVPAGPQVGAALAALRAACLRGALADRDDEIMFVRRWLESHSREHGT